MQRLMRSGIQMPVVLGSVPMPDGHLLPENVDVDILMSGSNYDIAVGGHVADVRIAHAIDKGSVLPSNLSEWMNGLAEYARELPGVKRLQYIGDGRFDVHLQFQGKLDAAQPHASVPAWPDGTSGVILIDLENDGAITISSAQPIRPLPDGFEGFATRFRGTVRIKTDGIIISHNADTGSAGGTCKWDHWAWENPLILRFSPSGNH